MREKRGDKRVRADDALVEAGLARDRKHAEALILAGEVILADPTGGERRIEKPGEHLARGSAMRIRGAHSFVSRGGTKLDHALDVFAIDPSGRVCADIGMSTGGFTDCLLRRGALRVHGVDVGYGIVAWSLRKDPRVRLHERTNARTLAAGAFGELVDLVVADVSFISLTLILPALLTQSTDRGEMLLLVKPQFELPKGEVEGGVVTDPEARRRAVAIVVTRARVLGLELLHEPIDSPIPGREGNVECFIHLGRETRAPA